MKNNLIRTYLAGLLGTALVFFMGWEYNIPAASWIAFPILIHAFRSMKKWHYALPVVVLLIAMRFFSINGGWDIELPLMVAFAALVTVPLVAALYLDRRFCKTPAPRYSDACISVRLYCAGLPVDVLPTWA